MPYRFATEAKTYADFASGRVFYSAPGHPALPVRLVSEIFQRGKHLLTKQGLDQPLILYDPCCGSAYHLSTLGFLHGPAIAAIFASDINPTILKTAHKNLSLLSSEGLSNREAELEQLYTQFQKVSHAEALTSLERLASMRSRFSGHRRIFKADATSSKEMATGLNEVSIDMVLADVPYGQSSAWQTGDIGVQSDETALSQMLEALTHLIAPHTVVAIIANKAQKPARPAYQRLDRFQIGHRRITFLQKKGRD